MYFITLNITDVQYSHFPPRLSPAPGDDCPAQRVQPEGRPRREEDAGDAEGLAPGIVRGSPNYA